MGVLGCQISSLQTPLQTIAGPLQPGAGAARLFDQPGEQHAEAPEPLPGVIFTLVAEALVFAPRARPGGPLYRSFTGSATSTSPSRTLQAIHVTVRLERSQIASVPSASSRPPTVQRSGQRSGRRFSFGGAVIATVSHLACAPVGARRCLRQARPLAQRAARASERDASCDRGPNVAAPISACLILSSTATISWSASASAQAKARQPGRRPLVGEHAMGERLPGALRQCRPLGVLAEDLDAELDMPEHPAGVAFEDFGGAGEAACVTQVVRQGGGQQQVGVEPRIHPGQLKRELGHRNRVLEQPAEVGVVAAAGAGRCAPRVAQRAVGEQRLKQRGVAGVVDLVGRVLEEPVQLVEVV
jgi:hypothetical protein